jgi:hypothetical protein
MLTDGRTDIPRTICAIVLLLLGRGRKCRLWARSRMLKLRRGFISNGQQSDTVLLKRIACPSDGRRQVLKWTSGRKSAPPPVRRLTPVRSVLSRVIALKRTALSAHWRLTGCKPSARSRGFAWFEPCTAMWMRSALFWDFTKRRVIFSSVPSSWPLDPWRWDL